MSEETKRSRRRRRRPRSSGQAKAKNQQKSQAKTEKPAKSNSRSRRGRPRRRPSGASRARRDTSQHQLKIQRHSEESVAPINKDIFIYTYTLRPRSLLDSYEAGPNVTERMTFEQSEQESMNE